MDEVERGIEINRHRCDAVLALRDSVRILVVILPSIWEEASEVNGHPPILTDVGDFKIGVSIQVIRSLLG